MIRILSFNTLASCFASKYYYPTDAWDYLTQDIRSPKQEAFLKNVKDEIDIIALQEVTYDTMEHLDHYKTKSKGQHNQFKLIMGPDFGSIASRHQKGYWNDYYNEDSSKTDMRHGNVIFYNSKTLKYTSHTVLTSRTGNRSIAATFIHIQTGKEFVVVNLHLEHKNSASRKDELEYVVRHLFKHYKGVPKIITGDFNSFPKLKRYTDALKTSGDTGTTFSFVKKTPVPIDHIYYETSAFVLIHAEVLDGGLREKHPFDGVPDIDGGKRIRSCLKQFGSDHFPIHAVLKIV